MHLPARQDGVENRDKVYAHLGFLWLGFQYLVKIFLPSAFLNDPSSETICILMLECILNKYTTKERV